MSSAVQQSSLPVASGFQFQRSWRRVRHENDDDSFSCRTDASTVKVSNVGDNRQSEREESEALLDGLVESFGQNASERNAFLGALAFVAGMVHTGWEGVTMDYLRTMYRSVSVEPADDVVLERLIQLPLAQWEDMRSLINERLRSLIPISIGYAGDSTSIPSELTTDRSRDDGNNASGSTGDDGASDGAVIAAGSTSASTAAGSSSTATTADSTAFTEE